MEENTKVNKEVIEKKEETLVVDEENRVLDIETILQERKDDTIVNNINNLLNCGSNYASKEVIKDLFSQKAGNLINEDIAMDVLQEIFTELVNEINNKDEFIAVDPKTGVIDKAKSQEKFNENAEHRVNKNGIESDFIDILEKLNEDKNGKSEIDSIFKTPEYRERKRSEVEDALGKIKDSTEHANERNNTQVTESVVGSELFENYNDALEMLNNYSKEELELIELEKKLEEAKGTVRYDDILKERTNFLKNNPDVEKKLIVPETGRVKKEDYKANEAQLIVGVIQEINFIKLSGIENLDNTARQRSVCNLIAGLEIEGMEESISKLLAELIPNYNPKEANSINNRIAIEKMLGIEGALHEEGYEALIKVCSEKLVKGLDLEAIKKNNGRFTEKDFQRYFESHSEELDTNAIKESIVSSEMKYFRGSNLEFSKEDEKAIKLAYQESTVVTWLNTKEKTINYRYAYLIKSKNELESLENISELALARLREIDKDIEQLKAQYPKLDKDIVLEDGNISTKWNNRMNTYSELKVISKLSKEFIKDEDKVNNYDDYNKLSNEEKKIYLRNTIVGLGFEPTDKRKNRLNTSKEVMTKLAKRRLEVLNNPQNQFIKIDGDNIEINEEAIFEEYSKLSRHKFKDYKEFADYCELNKMEYVNDKLKGYSNLGENSFKNIFRNNISHEILLEEIERQKAINYKAEFFGNMNDRLIGKMDAKKINELELSAELKSRIVTLDKQINNEDKDIMEFQRLQNEIEATYGENQKDAIKKRDELIRNNPDKRVEFLDCVENPVESAMRLEKYNNAIVEKNALLAIGTINSLSDENIKYLVENPELKRKILLTLVASLDGILEDYQMDLFSTIQKICPDSKMIDEETGKLISDFEILSPMIGKELGVEDCDMYKISSIMYSAKTIMLQNENSKKIDNVDEKDMNMALNLESLSKLSDMFTSTNDISQLTKNKEQKYFNNSKMEYTNKDVESFQQLYYKTISGAWIEDKETADKYRYIVLLEQNEERKKNPKFKEKALIAFENTLKEFEKNHPNLKKEDFMENGVLKESAKKEFSEYVNMKYTGDLISDYVIDEDKVESPEDYKKLSKKEKKDYMRKTIFGLMEENADNQIISKIAKRRLEIISSSNKSFIKDGDDLEIDEDAVFKEFDRLYDVSTTMNANSLDDVKKLYKNRQLMHAKVRLKFYDKYTSADEFKKLAPGDDESRAKEIEKYKANNSLKAALGGMGYQNSKEREKTPKESNEISSEVNRNNYSEKPDNSSDKSSRIQSENDDIDKSEMKKSENGLSAGIKLETIDINVNPEQEKKQNEQQISNDEIQNEEKPKLSLIDKIKSAISNFGKPNNENTNELALVETKSGFFDNIKNAVKNLFGKDENNVEELPELPDNQLTNVFDQRYKVEVDRSEVVNKFNDSKASLNNGKETEEDKDEVSYGE